MNKEIVKNDNERALSRNEMTQNGWITATTIIVTKIIVMPVMIILTKVIVTKGDALDVDRNDSSFST